MKTISPRFGLALITAATTLLSLAGLTPARAGFPEPDIVLYGHVAFSGRTLTAADNVVVQARVVPMGGALVQTTLGALGNDYYSLRLPIDSSAPVSRPGASLIGDTVYLTVLQNGQVKAQIPYDILVKGTVQQIDFGDVDTDHDGLPDGWEQAYLLDLSSGPEDDPDHDGLVNREEYKVGSHPLRVDAPHPADLNLKDNRITIAELSAYYSSWKKGLAWSISPTNIPIEYVTRASAIWEAGEYYRQDITVTNGAPLWWVSVPAPTNTGPASVTPEPGQSHVALMDASAANPPLAVEAILPAVFAPDTASVVMFHATVTTGLRAYAVEDYPPAGWRVESVSAGGSYDPINRKVKWGPFFDRTSREMYYTVVPDRVTDGLAFTGVGSYDGRLVPMSGRRTVGATDSITGTGTGSGAGSRLSFAGALAQWSVRGQPGVSYSVEHSEDLLEWKVLTNGVADAQGQFLFGPAILQSQPSGFFRASELGAGSTPPGAR